MNTPPTWRSSAVRALIAAAIVLVFLLLSTKGKNRVATAAIFTVIALVIYIPAGYYLELALFRRRQRKRAMASGEQTRRKPRGR